MERQPTLEPQRLNHGAPRECTPQQRSPPHFSRPGEGRFAQRKPTPSPLQASETPRSNLDGNIGGPSQTSPHSPRSPTTFRTASGPQYPYTPRSPRTDLKADVSPPKSPRDRLDELLASEASATKDITGSSNDVRPFKADLPTSSKTQSYSQLRNISSPLPQGRLGDISPPVSPLSSTSTNLSSATMRQDARSFPRTSSIDSAISNISTTTSNSHKSSQDSGGSETPDISNLVAAAGSKEALIHHLLKEKQHGTAQNAQLWKLVDKQRALVLGLNQDLERALKDKERYRKKLKEYMSQVPPLPDKVAPVSALGPSVGSTSLNAREIRGRAATTESTIDAPHTDSVPRGNSGSDIAPTNEQSRYTTAAPEVAKESTAVNPGKSVPSLQTANLGGPRSNTLPEGSPQNPTGVVSPSSFTAKRSNNAQKLTSGPAGALTESTPISASEQSSLPVRKLPPAPLDLHKPKAEATKPSDLGPEDHSGSDYEDDIDLDELPTFERGRKTTREEDDQEREVAAIKQHLGRSQSKKEKGSKTPSGSAPPKTGVSHISVKLHSPMPAGIKGLSPHPASGGDASFLSQPTSLASVLSPPTKQQRRSSSEGMTMSGALSPGLPSSPRPTDRPINPPTPRLPRESKTASMLSAPLSPRNGLPQSPRAPTHAMPLSPRAPRQPIPMPPHTPSSITPPTSQNADLGPEPLVAVRRPVSPPQAHSPPASPSLAALPLRSPHATSLPPRHPPPSGSPPAQPNLPNFEPVTQQKPSRKDIPGDWRPEGVYKGYISDAYPTVLIPPNALPSIRVKVVSSRLKPSRHSYTGPRGSDEESVFTLGVSARSNRQELWQVEKSVFSLPPLDNQMKEASVLSVKLPDRSLFTGHAPAKIDARRVALEAYFEAILDTPMDEKAALILCRYLSTQVIESRADNTAGSSLPPEAGSPVTLGPDGRLLKEGFLTKRGKNFGGWKARYFVVDEPVLRYYESPGGSLLGTIRLQNAQIGKQSQHNHSPSRAGDDSDSQYRHAFLIMEPKRNSPNSHVRHVLCAENDAERDVWVEALLHYVDGQAGDDRARSIAGSMDSGSSKLVKKSVTKPQDMATQSPESETFNELRGVGYESTVAAQKPTVQIMPEQRPTESPSPTTALIPSTARGQGAYPSKAISRPSNGTKIEDPGSWGAAKAISGPSNGVKIENAGAWGNKTQMAPPAQSKEHKKRSNFWGLRDRHPSDLSTAYSNESSLSLPQQQTLERAANVRPVFGIPIAEAVHYCPPRGMPDVCLPAVVYRCLEYLEAQDAANEEGIFRLSGSSVVIKGLRDRFNNEGDFDILADEHYFDVHAVASLLKLYLRELPSTILTRDLHLEFLKVLDLDEKSKKIAAYNLLVHRLPRPNWALIRALSAFLISIINNADINKMSVRNVGIVFSPTLNIPAPVFAMFLTEFDAIFGEEPEDPDMTPPDVSITEPLTPEDIRSPRRQMFSDIPTPSYSQDSFPHLHQSKAQQPTHEQFAQGLQAEHDTGMIPLQPSYETATSFGPSRRKPSGDGAAKARRRESSMLLMSGGMGAGQRKSSMPMLRSNSGMVREESAFE